MDRRNTEIVDSQILADHVAFLDNCFDNTFILQSSLLAVKEYVSQEQNGFSNIQKAKKNTTVFNISNQGNNTLLENSYCNQSLTSHIKVCSNLKDWGLPTEIIRKYAERGISKMFDWQIACLSNSKVLLDCCNLVYSAPTSAGKTLVAEILTIKTILERQKKVIIILPFVSIVREKMFYLQDILSSSGIRVEGFMGSQSPPGGLQAVHVAICTIEKANSLINRLLDDGKIFELGSVIVDEMHLLGDPNRGYILELLLTKLKYISSKYEDVKIQIIGMSATLPNLKMLANWLNAELFVTDFRPIPLDEYCLVGTQYYDKHGIIVNTMKPICSNSDNVLEICLDTIKDGCSILIFCMTKNRCENLALSISSTFFKLGSEPGENGSVLRNQLNSQNILEVLEQLRNCPVGLDDVLRKTISFGVAYHHAGLTFDERDIVEGGFKSGAIRVLIATSTLSSGVNLPARKVIIRTPVFQRQPINILTYKQMVGRAGRMGKDTKGESILICTEIEKKIGFNLMMGELNPVKSCIDSEDKYMRALLEMIASQNVFTNAELILYSKCTLLYAQQNELTSQDLLLQNTLDDLKNYELIRTQMNGEELQYVATALGKACLSSSMAPNDGLSLFCELQRARQCLVLETDLHLIYLVTPYSVSSQWGDIDWLHLLTLWESLTKAMQRVGELVGVQESFIVCCLRAANKCSKDHSKLNIHKRFYTALALQDLVNEVPLSEVATKFQCARGFLQSLQQAAATFAGMVTAFCRQLGWNNMEILISQFQDRLHFGIHSDLLELMKLSSLNGMRARTLFNAGFETISSIALADPNIIENVLLKAMPFESEKEKVGDDLNDIRKRKKLKNIWITGLCGLTAKDAAVNLINEARRYLEQEIGISEIKWNANIFNCQNNLMSLDGEKVIITEQELGCEIIKPIDNELDILVKSGKQMLKSRENLNDVDMKSNTQMVTSSQSANKMDSVKESDYHTLSIQNETIHNLSRNQNKECTSIKVKTELFIPDEVSILQNPSSTTNNNNLHLISKDEIGWESLNLTQGTIENITKIQTSQKQFSPNISFGETENENANISNQTEKAVSSKCTSDKDLSLFSFDGDNSSLFEESFTLGTNSNNFFDNQNTKDISLSNIKIDSDTIVNGLKSIILDKDDDEDFKLVYEDDKSQPNNEVVYIEPEINKVKIVNNFNNKFKRRNPTVKVSSEPDKKKMKIDNEIKSINKIQKSLPLFTLKINNENSKSFILEFGQYKLNCFLLKGNDIIDNIHIIKNIQHASIYLNTKNLITAPNEIIGGNIFRVPKSSIVDNKSWPIKGIAVYFGEMKCIYFDYCSYDSNHSIIKDVMSTWFRSKSLILKLMSLKSVNFHIKRWLDIDMLASCVDISLLEWLTDSDEKIPNISSLLKKYCGIDFSTITFKSDDNRKRYQNLDISENVCLKTWAVWMVAEQQRIQLKQLHADVIDVEIQISKILSNCEHYGVTVDKELASRLLIDVRNTQEKLQKKAFKLCGHHFNFNASKDVAKALGIYNGRKMSTKKSVLTSHHSPMSSIVIYWRKLNSILTKTLYPLTEKAWIYSEGDRINPTYSIYTCTGRISMHEPNLQNVPRTFSIPLEYLIFNCVKTGGKEVVEFNCRNIFKATPGYVMVSADYCQLEMRLLTHFSEDSVLMDIMKSDVDVFKSIAATWGNLPENEVDDDLRQKAKQLCYGILYGMGNRTLAQHLDVTEIEAGVFMETFYNTYPSIKAFTRTVVDECRKTGYVETLTKRRRYIPDINSIVISKRNTAERQAVNTTIQGSAADIAKAAMCAIDTKTNDCDPKPRLILQMHDELIYEVPESKKNSFISIIKQVMEDTVKLRVPLPVKVKCGHTWGGLTEVPLTLFTCNQTR